MVTNRDKYKTINKRLLAEGKYVQLYVHIDTLIPKEPAKFPYYRKSKHGELRPFDDPAEKAFLDYDPDFVDCDCFLEDIRKNGIKHPLYVSPDGHIIDGNCRYWCAKKLGIQYLPVYYPFFIGEFETEALYPKPALQVLCTD